MTPELYLFTRTFQIVNNFDFFLLLILKLGVRFKYCIYLRKKNSSVQRLKHIGKIPITVEQYYLRKRKYIYYQLLQSLEAKLAPQVFKPHGQEPLSLVYMYLSPILDWFEYYSNKVTQVLHRSQRRFNFVPGENLLKAEIDPQVRYKVHALNYICKTITKVSYQITCITSVSAE